MGHLTARERTYHALVDSRTSLPTARPPLLGRGPSRWLGAAGLAFLAIAAALALHSARFEARAVEATGVVISLERRSPLETAASTAVIGYSAGDGVARTLRARVWRTPPEYALGAPVAVAFDPRDPGHAHVRSFAERWGVPLLVLVAGLPFLLVAAVGLWRARRRGE